MPNRNGTGPEGKGPGTGRGMGNCSSDNNLVVDSSRYGQRQNDKEFGYNRKGLGMKKGSKGLGRGYRNNM